MEIPLTELVWDKQDEHGQLRPLTMSIIWVHLTKMLTLPPPASRPPAISLFHHPSLAPPVHSPLLPATVCTFAAVLLPQARDSRFFLLPVSLDKSRVCQKGMQIRTMTPSYRTGVCVLTVLLGDSAHGGRCQGPWGG